MRARITISVPDELSFKFQDKYTSIDSEFGSLNYILKELLDWIKEKYPQDVEKWGNIIKYQREIHLNTFTAEGLSYSPTSTDYIIEVPENFSFEGLDMVFNEFLQDPKWSTPGSFTGEILP
jgi:hypothetical protein